VDISYSISPCRKRYEYGGLAGKAESEDFWLIVIDFGLIVCRLGISLKVFHLSEADHPKVRPNA
jgi:hypothetical protein